MLHFKDLTEGSLGVSIPFKGNNWWTLQFATEHVNYSLCLGLLLVTIYVSHRIHNSRMGYYLQAIKEDQDAAESMGVPLTLLKNKALAISAGLTAAMVHFTWSIKATSIPMPSAVWICPFRSFWWP